MMYKILHIPTAQVVCDFDLSNSAMKKYIDNRYTNGVTFDYSVVNKHYKLYPILFKTEQEAYAYLSKFTLYTTCFNDVVLFKGTQTGYETAPINYNHFEIIEHV